MRSKTKESLHFVARATSTNIFHYWLNIFFPAVSDTSGGQSFILTGSSDLDEIAQHATLSGNNTYTSCETLSLSIKNKKRKVQKKKKIPLRASGHPTQLTSWCAVKSYVSLLLNGKLIAGDNIMRQNIHNTVSPSLRQPQRKKILSALPAVVMRRCINMSLRGSEELTEIEVWERFSSPLPAQPASQTVKSGSFCLVRDAGKWGGGGTLRSALLWCAACLLTSKQPSSRTVPQGRKRVITSYTQRKWEEKAPVDAHARLTHFCTGSPFMPHELGWRLNNEEDGAHRRSH